MTEQPLPTADQPITCLAGATVALGPIQRAYLPLYQRWMNDWMVTRTLGQATRPYTFEAEVAWYDAASTAEREYSFTIFERPTLRPIGNTSLFAVDQQHRTGELGLLIGERSRWNRGYGTETCRLMLDYGFTVLGLHNIMLRVYAFNPRGIAAYRRAGFREVGRRREAVRLAGRAYDVVFMDCLASEFESPVLRDLLSADATGAEGA